MTFIVTLAHFCEVHGPSMVMCTQMSSPHDSPSVFYSSKIPSSQLCESCRLKLPLESKSYPSPTEPSVLQTSSKATGFTYVTTQFPTSQHRYSALRHIIMRVFTIETSSDIDQPLIFGDVKVGYSMALLFKIFDRSARGSERKYALIVTSDKEADIFKNYSTILLNLTSIAKHITNKAVNMAENQSKNLNNNEIYLRRSTSVPQSKNLITIMHDPTFFVRLHLLSSRLLDQLECNTKYAATIDAKDD